MQRCASTAAMEIKRDCMDGAADAADVEPKPTPSLGPAPIGAGVAGDACNDVDMSTAASEGCPPPMHGQASGWPPNGARLPHLHIFFGSCIMPENTWGQSLMCTSHLPSQVKTRLYPRVAASRRSSSRIGSERSSSARTGLRRTVGAQASHLSRS